MRVWLRIILGLVLCAPIQGVRAQIVNMQNALSGDLSEGPGATLEMRQEQKSGNTETERLAAQGSLSYKTPDDLWLLVVKREYSTEDGTSSTDNRFYHLRYRYQLNDSWSWEAYGQEDADRFRKSARRTVLGTGPRYQVTPLENLELALSVAYMHENEEFSGSDSEEREPDRITKRVSHVAFVNYALEGWGELANVVYFQPEIGHIANHRTLNEASLSLKINQFLSYKLTHSYAYNHRPPPGVETTDRSFLQSLLLKL